MEVFLCFSPTDPLALVEMTMQAWEPIQWAEPFNVVQVPVHDFEIRRRVIADRMAKEDHYILVDLGCVPENERAIPQIEKLWSSKDGLMGLDDATIPTPHGIRVVRKGMINKWPTAVTTSYDEDHAIAVEQAGFNVSTCPITFKRIQDC